MTPGEEGLAQSQREVIGSIIGKDPDEVTLLDRAEVEVRITSYNRIANVSVLVFTVLSIATIILAVNDSPRNAFFFGAFAFAAMVNYMRYSGRAWNMIDRYVEARQSWMR